ncbi:putative ribonuclease H protein [Sesbania bispinosa]|nr:putative ribonuclease H protein [Sesbania bispinosa]
MQNEHSADNRRRDLQAYHEQLNHVLPPMISQVDQVAQSMLPAQELQSNSVKTVPYGVISAMNVEVAGPNQLRFVDELEWLDREDRREGLGVSWELGCFGNLGNTGILEAELFAILQGLRLCKTLGTPIVINKNSYWSNMIHHILREENQSVDFMAKLGVTSSFLLTQVHDPLRDLIPLLQVDARGL